MCIIIAKKAGVEPLDTGYFERAWDHNGDGGGVVWKKPKDDSAYIQKGFMKKEDMMEKLKEINTKENSFIAHFRIKSVGEVKPENTHPFVMDKVTFAHNGTICGVHPEDGKTDSETFGLMFLKNRSMKWIKENQKLLELALGSSKFAIMDNKTGEIFILNEQNGKEQDGAWFSNGSADKPTPITTRSYDYDFVRPYYRNSNLLNFDDGTVMARKFFGTKSFTENFGEYRKEDGCWVYTSTKKPMSTHPFTTDIVISRNGMWKINPAIQPSGDNYEPKEYKRKAPEFKLIGTMQRDLQKNLATYWKQKFSCVDEREEYELDLSAENIVVDAARRFIRNGLELDFVNLENFVLENMNLHTWCGSWQREKADMIISCVQNHIATMFGEDYWIYE